MIPSDCNLTSNHWVQWLVVGLVLAWEAWLGRSRIFKPNSTVELIAAIVVALFAAFIKRRKSDG